MGSNQSQDERQPVPEELYCCIDMEVYPRHNFKVLSCGHYFCKPCLRCWVAQSLASCPKCRQEEDCESVEELVGLQQFKGKIFYENIPAEENSLNINVMIKRQLCRRSKTIRILQSVACEISSVEMTTAGVKVGGSVTGIVGSGLVIAGGITALTGVGAVVGVPLMMAGAVVGGVGGAIVGGGVIGEAIAKKVKMDSVNTHLNADYFHSVQLGIFARRAAEDKSFANKIDLKVEEAASLLGMLGRVAKVSTATVNLARTIAYGVARGVSNTGLHIAGIALSAVLIPIDLWQLIMSSIQIHNNDKSAIVRDIEILADKFITHLFPIFREKNYQVAEFQRFDNEKRKHTMLLALEEGYEEIELKNLSYEDVENNYAVLVDLIGDVDVAQIYSDLFTKLEGE